jgi:pyruvate-formate lyase-activating enzyme
METFPVYPYAFIQVPAIARQFGIEIICKDLLGIPEEKWGEIIEQLISHHDPSMFLVTLRNTDTLTATDYERAESEMENNQPYFPIERTKELVTTIRKISDLKIVVGGFGFSVLPEEMMQYLWPDYGVFGGSDAFFEHLADIEAGKFDEVANLLYFRDEKLISNPRMFFPPFSEGEYTPEIIDEMLTFYTSFPNPGFQGAPIEINRGCNHTCVFCSEPLVKGNQVGYREISAIMDDIELLVEHGINKFYMITSELNPDGNEFILRLADNIAMFNSNLDKDHKITWFGANYLLKFSVAEYNRLYKSGFTGGWFDITALDDENAREMRTPYRIRSVLKHLKDYALVKRELKNRAEEGDGQDELISWTMFLGNPSTTIETIRNTLKTAHQEGISQMFESCGLFTHIRVFDYEEPDQNTLAVTYSVNNDLKRKNYQQILPSFAFPPALLQDFSENEIAEMFKYLGETYLSTKYVTTREWDNFVNQKTTPTIVSQWLKEIESIKGEQILENSGIASLSSNGRDIPVKEQSPEGGWHLDADQSRKVIGFLISFCIENFPDYFDSLGLPNTAEDLSLCTPYDLAKSIYSRWSWEEELFDEINSQSQSYSPEWKQDLLRFCARAIIHKFNVVVKSKYKEFFV